MKMFYPRSWMWWCILIISALEVEASLGYVKLCLKEPPPQTNNNKIKQNVSSPYIFAVLTVGGELLASRRPGIWPKVPRWPRWSPETSSLSNTKARHAVPETSTLNGPFRKEG